MMGGIMGEVSGGPVNILEHKKLGGVGGEFQQVQVGPLDVGSV